MVASTKQVLVFVVFSFALSCLTFAGSVSAAEPVLKFANDEQAKLYLRLTEEFRCLKCQNQNLADSNAGLASDLRDEIYQAVIAGQDRDQIADYLVARYGDFVLYRPPVKRLTYLLWFGPYAFLLFAFIGAYRIGVRKTKIAAPAPSDALEAAKQRLND